MLALAVVESHSVSREDFETAGTVYQIGVPPRRIDLLTSISGLPWEEAEQGAITVNVDGLNLQVLGREELLANKLAAGRPKDVVDANLLRTDEERRDRDS